MTLPLAIRKWLGTWWGDYCPVCGDKMFFDEERHNAGYTTRSQCLNKKCKNYAYNYRRTKAYRKLMKETE